ncbi:zinc finger (Ran-binding) family protein [Striga asiatica]|uniref:Zinc finger (Ran-binding) family protein n=1 Tax=Striga asiatica TaxID=4170 RepID=A0A5A7P5K0_STRAF|nr:zinc finger (Ran-binding) family protein [Striga asiatica]
MGSATRFTALLTVPMPPIRPSLIIFRRRLSALSFAPRFLLTLSSSSSSTTQITHLVNSLHSQSSSTSAYTVHPTADQNHPWPEWTNFLNILSSGQRIEDKGIPPEDAFVVYEELSDDFVRSAATCIAFAHARPNLLGLLSRKDIEAVVSNGTPFLFKSALDSVRRMRAFLGTGETNVSELDKATTIDLMKYILSYASNPTVSSESKGLYSKELVYSSVRKLLHELGTVCSGVPTGYIPVSRQTQKPYGQNIEMKRGDWICPKTPSSILKQAATKTASITKEKTAVLELSMAKGKPMCNFMNFAKNMKCLECEGPRPKRQLTGGEWDCPQCNFFNYGRNFACLRCDCKRPGAPLSTDSTSQLNSVHNNYFPNKTNTDNERSKNSQQWFNKISKLNSANSSNNAALNERASPMDNIRHSQYSEAKNGNFQNQGMEGQAQKSERWFEKMSELHNVKDLPSAVSDEDFPETMPMLKGESRFVVGKKKDHSLTSSKNKQPAIDQTNSTNFVPFVPFPPGYFARKNNDADPEVKKDDPKLINLENSNFSSGGAHDQPSSPILKSTEKNNVGPGNGGYWAGKSLEGSGVKESDPLDMSEEAINERWFRRAAQIKDISELSQIPDEDFPPIMPMLKGVNRFVVSKRKTPLERRLTSQKYKRNLPMVSSESVKKESDGS